MTPNEVMAAAAAAPANNMGAVLPPSASRVEQMAKHLVNEGVAPEAAATVAAEIDARLWISPTTGQTVVLDRDGRADPNMTVSTLLMEQRRQFPDRFAAPVKRSSTATDQAPNPYRKATRNLTRQAVLERDDPARAARLRVEAGK